MTSIFEGQPHKNKVFSNKNKGHLGSRYIYIGIYVEQLYEGPFINQPVFHRFQTGGVLVFFPLSTITCFRPKLPDFNVTSGKPKVAKGDIFYVTRCAYIWRCLLFVLYKLHTLNENIAIVQYFSYP